MARFLLVVTSVLVAAMALVRCSSAPKNSLAGAQWFSNMHRLSNAHLALMPLEASSKEFSDPAKRAEIEGYLKEFADAAIAISKDEKAPDADPLIQFSAQRTALEAKQAYRAFQMNDQQWARYSLSRASGYCISCHTRADRGAKDFPMAWTPQLGALSPAQRVEFLLANRRYSSAYDTARQLASSSTAPQANPRAWIVSIERTLAMVVRVSKDYAQAEALAQAVVDNKSAPFYMRSEAARWLLDIRQWKKSSGKPVSDRFEQAVALMKTVRSGSRGGLIANLRASGLLHEELENSKSPHYAEALLYAGIVAQSLGDVNQGFLDQFYFESCIRQSPHTELAEQCYDQLERSVQASNPFLDMEPEIEWYRLTELRKLAEVQHVQDPAWKRRSWEHDLNEAPLDWRKKK